jgi:hypothetical protein
LLDTVIGSSTRRFGVNLFVSATTASSSGLRAGEVPALAPAPMPTQEAEAEASGLG